ncbi:MAG: ArdC-like ssDNA-binding domain-containing protein [Treponema sp.]|nr:ArdC-like ssDNA-binding domain-containing protein [Treponema sp.]
MTAREEAAFDAAYEEQYVTDPINRKKPPLEGRNNNDKENSMTNEFESGNEEKKDLTPKEQAFLNTVHQRKVIMGALKEGTLSCLPGPDGYADTKPAFNMATGKMYHGTNLLYLKEHQKQHEFPTGEYITAGYFDRIKKDNPDLYIRKGEKGVSIHFSEKNEENGEWEDKNVRLFNVAQTSKPWEVKAIMEVIQKNEQQKYIEYMRSQYGSKWEPPEAKVKEPGPDIACTSTEPAKYLGQYLAAVSMGGKFKASPEQAAEFSKNMESLVYEKVGVSQKSGEPTTNPFKLLHIGVEASGHCKEAIKEARMETQKMEQPEQKIEQQQSRKRGM